MVTEAIGVIGGILCLIAFVEVSLGRWDGRSFRYELYNLLAGLFLGYYAIQKEAYTNIVLNLVWGSVALYAISHIITRHKIRTGKAVHRVVVAKKVRRKA